MLRWLVLYYTRFSVSLSNLFLCTVVFNFILVIDIKIIYIHKISNVGVDLMLGWILINSDQYVLCEACIQID